MLSLLLSLAAAAVPTANPGRPSFSDNASPTARGAMELETGALFDPSGFGMSYLVKFGVHRKIDLRVGFDQLLTPAFAPGPFTFMLKGTFQKPRDRVLGAAVAPFLALQPGSRQPGFGGYLIVTYPQGDVQVDANLLLEMVPGAGSYGLQIDPVVTLGFPISGDLGGYVESYGIFPTGGETPGAFALAAGLGYAVRKNIVLDAGADFGFHNDLLIPPWQVQVGATFSGYLKEPKHKQADEGKRKKDGKKGNKQKVKGKGSMGGGQR